MYSEPAYGTEHASICALVAGCHTSSLAYLREVLQQVCSQTLEANQLADVGKILRYRKDVSVLFCGPELADGTWHDVAELVQSIPRSPMLILGLAEPDAMLWTELLEVGGFGICAPPWYPEGVRAMVEAAYKRWLRTAEVAAARAENLQHIRAQRHAC